MSDHDCQEISMMIYSMVKQTRCDVKNAVGSRTNEDGLLAGFRVVSRCHSKTPLTHCQRTSLIQPSTLQMSAIQYH
jgi:hypothetical protein